MLTTIGLLTAVPAVAAVALDLIIGWAIAVPEVAAAPEAALVAGGEPAAGGDPFAGAAAAVQPPRQRALSETQYIDGILGRNIFDMDKIGVEADGGEGGEGGDGVAQSDLNATLKGTVVAVPETFSAAFILEDGKKSAYAYGIGQRILDAEILEILEDRIRIKRGNGKEEWLTLSDKETKPPTTKPTAAAPEDENVEKLGENEYVVDRSMLQQHLEDLEGLSRMGRALLHRGPDGEFDGYRLSAIRRGSLPDKLGIRNGDIIHSVNGMDLNSVQGAMQALQALQNENSLGFKVTRRGQPVDLNYQVR
jgi:general secretion pathway protein C